MLYVLYAKVFAPILTAESRHLTLIVRCVEDVVDSNGKSLTIAWASFLVAFFQVFWVHEEKIE